MLPTHGKIDCSTCFKKPGETAMPHIKWKMNNDPGSWGSQQPEYLVLGFSKGSTQANIYDKGKFEDIAFAGMRPRLTLALRAMGVLSEKQTVDQKIADPKSNIAFGSLIRCSVARVDDKASKLGDPVYSCTGPLIPKSFKEIPHIIDACASRYIVGLPKSVKAVFFLGNADQYVEGCQSLLRKLFPRDFGFINPMAVRADGRVWVHLAHPSGLNGHFNTWLNTEQGPGLKRLQARAAMP